MDMSGAGQPHLQGGQTDRPGAGQPHLQGVPGNDQCTVVFPSKGIQLQVGFSTAGHLHKKKKKKRAQLA